jgi:hypothetical protein
VIPLLDLGPVPGFGKEFERRLEEVHIQADHSVKAGEALAGDQAGEPVVAHEPPDHCAVLLLDPGLVWSFAKSRSVL